MKIFYYFIILVLAGCSLNTNNKRKATDYSDTLLNKKIIFPKELLVLDNGTLIDPNSVLKSIEGKQKIISIVDGNCVKCIVNQMNVLDSIFLRMNNKGIIFILNVNKNDSAYFFKNIEPFINIHSVILWDSNYYFETQNQLFTNDINLRTFITNMNNNIIFYGNPILYPEIVSKYEELLNF